VLAHDPAALIEARIPKKRIRARLESLRHNLPESMPLSGLAISAVGDHVVVRDGDARWQSTVASIFWASM